MCLAQGPQRSDAGEARTRGPSVSSQALYHWATALPTKCVVITKWNSTAKKYYKDKNLFFWMMTLKKVSGQKLQGKDQNFCIIPC